MGNWGRVGQWRREKALLEVDTVRRISPHDGNIGVVIMQVTHRGIKLLHKYGILHVMSSSIENQQTNLMWIDSVFPGQLYRLVRPHFFGLNRQVVIPYDGQRQWIVRRAILTRNGFACKYILSSGVSQATDIRRQ